MYSLHSSRPMGMQMHAVPESERAIDNTGRRLPWGYEYAPPSTSMDPEQKEQTEKGSFGRSARRTRNGFSRSRSKTAEPRREEDRTRAENIAAEDAVFGTLKRVVRDEIRRDVATDADTVQPTVNVNPEPESEPTEVLLYGFGEELQWAAIDFYERVSNGSILEDYDRSPPGQRYDISRSYGRHAVQRSISRAAMRKKNKFAGGLHWIKVTFDSRQAAELAIARQPHIIKGYLVYAEPFNGHGPQKDEPVYATEAGAQITSDALPITFSTKAIDDSPSASQTMSSATATSTGHTPTEITHQAPRLRFAAPGSLFSANYPDLDETNNPPNSHSIAVATSSALNPPHPGGLTQRNSIQRAPASRRARIEGATRAVLLPAELALAPKRPRPSWSSWVGASEIIGSAVPRKDDGAFDWDKASLYWRLFHWIDTLLGTDFCGLKLDD